MHDLIILLDNNNKFFFLMCEKNIPMTDI